MELSEEEQGGNARPGSRLSSEIAGMIRAERIAAGLTQQQFAERCGSTQGRISDIESGHVGISITTLERLARGLNKELEIRFM